MVLLFSATVTFKILSPEWTGLCSVGTACRMPRQDPTVGGTGSTFVSNGMIITCQLLFEFLLQFRNLCHKCVTDNYWFLKRIIQHRNILTHGISLRFMDIRWIETSWNTITQWSKNKMCYLEHATCFGPKGTETGFIYLYSKSNQMHQFLKLFILVKHSTCLERSFRPSSGAQGCTYSNRHMSKSCC
jgi:hypothetical protein